MAVNVAVVPGVLSDRRHGFDRSVTAPRSSSVTGLRHRSRRRKIDDRRHQCCLSTFTVTRRRAVQIELVFAHVNIRSLANKLDDLLDVRRDLAIDVLFLGEMWHDADSVSFSRLHADGFQVVDRPRPRVRDDLSTNYGGVAVVAVPGVRLMRLDVGIQCESCELSAVVCARDICVVVLRRRRRLQDWSGDVSLLYWAV